MCHLRDQCNVIELGAGHNRNETDMLEDAAAKPFWEVHKTIEVLVGTTAVRRHRFMQ